MSDLYGVLGVPSNVDETALKAAYWRLAKASHPDLHGNHDCAVQRFKEVKLAYETLANPKARATYDAQRYRARREWRSIATTMSASFVLTVTWGYFAAKWWLGV
jgi:curved DNA-binding protein CbpA